MATFTSIPHLEWSREIVNLSGMRLRFSKTYQRRARGERVVGEVFIRRGADYVFGVRSRDLDRRAAAAAAAPACSSHVPARGTMLS